MHSGFTFSDLAWAFGIPALQILVSIRSGITSLRVFLFTLALSGIILAMIGITFPEGSLTYFYAWIAGTVLHHGLCAFLLANLFTIVRRRGLPSRQSVLPLYIMCSGALMLGFHFAGISYGLLHCDPARLIYPMDHAFSFAIASMVAFLPLYSIAISATIPTNVRFVIAGFAIYEFAYVGMVSSVIVYNRIYLPHAVDLVYLVSLVLWHTAIRSKHPEAAEERSPIAIQR